MSAPSILATARKARAIPAVPTGSARTMGPAAASGMPPSMRRAILWPNSRDRSPRSQPVAGRAFMRRRGRACHAASCARALPVCQCPAAPERRQGRICLGRSLSSCLGSSPQLSVPMQSRVLVMSDMRRPKTPAGACRRDAQSAGAARISGQIPASVLRSVQRAISLPCSSLSTVEMRATTR